MNALALALVLALTLAGLTASAQAADPLERRDFHSRTTCAKDTTPQECRQQTDRTATIQCPEGKAFAGFREPDKKFHVWCGSPPPAQHLRGLTCPAGTVIQAGVAHISNVWTLRCVLPSRELQGPFLEWYSSDGIFKTLTSGAYERGKPQGVWKVEDAGGKIVASGRLGYSPTSINNGEKHGRWEEWSDESGKSVVHYYTCGVLSSEKDYLKYRKDHAALADVCEGD
jgi:hypothetical protein